MAGYNQYIGMRYVPLIDGAWSATKTYEPLVVVSYEGNSYISKTFVPAGTLPTNETYWLLSANYNAQVEQYRQEVRQYQSTVDDMADDITSLQSGLADVNGDLDVTPYFLGGVNFNISTSESVQPTFTAYLSGSTSIGDWDSIINFKRKYPNAAIRVMTLTPLADWGVPYAAATTVTESGSVANNNYQCIVNGTASVRNMSNITQSNMHATAKIIVYGIRKAS